MSPTTKTKLMSVGDVNRVFDVLQLSSDEKRESFRAMGRFGTEKRDPRLVYVTRLSNGTAPNNTDD